MEELKPMTKIMIELNEEEITAKGEEYAESKSVHFKPFLGAYTKAISNAYIDVYVAGLLAYNRQMEPFLNNNEIIRE